MQFLYESGGDYVFMNAETYEQMSLPADFLGKAVQYLKEEMVIDVMINEGKAITFELPTFVVLKVTETDPGVRGDTASGGSKPAKLETGAVVQVPLFLEQGEMIKVDTRTGAYVERASS